MSEIRSSRERAIVSGATSGIGRAVAVRLAQRGAIVALLGRNASAAEEVAAAVERAGGTPFVAQTDITDLHQVESVVQQFIAAHGGIETVVSSAGVAATGSVTDTSVEDWDR